MFKIKELLKELKKNFIIFGIIWAVLTILFIVPFSYGIIKGMETGSFNISQFSSGFMGFYGNFFGCFKEVFTGENVDTFTSVLSKFSIAYVILVIILLLRMDKHGYEGIEHGSGDWAGGERFSVLSPNKGILLAEKTYLPTDKRGNVNILVVGRLWFW